MNVALATSSTLAINSKTAASSRQSEVTSNDASAPALPLFSAAAPNTASASTVATAGSDRVALPFLYSRKDNNLTINKDKSTSPALAAALHPSLLYADFNQDKRYIFDLSEAVIVPCNDMTT